MSKKSCKSYTYVQKSNQARLSESDLMGVKSDKKRADDAVKRAFSVIKEGKADGENNEKSKENGG